tara:strand:- start:738 stop:1007 length:270 start_codon:yes stop_codon:yes gene_type:complete
MKKTLILIFPLIASWQVFAWTSEEKLELFKGCMNSAIENGPYEMASKYCGCITNKVSINFTVKDLENGDVVEMAKSKKIISYCNKLSKE